LTPKVGSVLEQGHLAAEPASGASHLRLPIAFSSFGSTPMTLGGEHERSLSLR